MSDLYWLMDEGMARLQPFFLNSHGKPRVDDRLVLSGIVFVDRSGLRWCDMTKDYGPAQDALRSLEAVKRDGPLRRWADPLSAIPSARLAFQNLPIVQHSRQRINHAVRRGRGRTDNRTSW